MDNDKLIELAERFLRGEATEAEKQQLHTWYDSMGGEEERVFTDWPETAEVVRVRILESLQKQIAGQQPKQVSLPLRRYGFAAAVVLFLLGTGVYFWPLNRIKPPLVQSQLQSLQNDVAPGGNKAILTLANGSTIILDSAHTGELARQGGAAVVKADSGQLVYHAGEGNATDVVYNTLTTPKGGQFELVLPDGTKLWLNAASSVTYPTAFTGNERKVLVTGEAYFEVRKNVSQPFKVAINGKEEIEVLGTSFNVNGL
jgi:transmembrane sensor